MKEVFEVSDTQKPIATIEDIQKIGALLQFFGINIYRTESGLFRADPYIWALTELGRLGYSMTEKALVYGGGEASISGLNLDPTSLHGLKNWKRHPTYILYKNIRELMFKYRERWKNGVMPSKLSESQFNKLLGITSHEYIPSRLTKLEEGYNQWFDDDALFSWALSLKKDSLIKRDDFNRVWNHILFYRRGAGLSYSDPATDAFIRDLKFAFSSGNKILSNKQLSDLLGLTDPAQHFSVFDKALNKRWTKGPLREILHAIYKKCHSSNFILKNLGKDQSNDFLGVPDRFKEVSNALLAFNKFTIKKGYDSLYEPNSLQELLMLSRWYLSESLYNGEYCDNAKLAKFFGISRRTINNYVKGTRQYPDSELANKIENGFERLKGLINSGRRSILGRVYKQYKDNLLDFESYDVHRTADDIHVCYEEFLIRYLKTIGILCTRQVPLSNRRKPDNTIHRTLPNGEVNPKWIEIEKSLDFSLQGINEIIVDYTSSSNEDDLFNLKHPDSKLSRNYHSKDRFLIIVLFGVKNPQRVLALKQRLEDMQSASSQNDPIRNIKLMTTGEFSKFLSLDGDFLTEFNDIQKLEQIALNPRASADEKLKAREKIKELKISAMARLATSNNNFLGVP